MDIKKRLGNTVYNIQGIHLSNVPMLLFEKVDVDFDNRMKAIKAFTSGNIFFHMFYKGKGFHLQKVNNCKYSLKFQDESLEFSKLSDLLSHRNILKNLFLKCELLSLKRRVGRCHLQSLVYLPIIGGSVVTGYVNDSSGKSRVIHSVIVNKETVFDYSNNLVASIKNYDQLFDLSVLSEVSEETLINDAKSPLASLPIGVKFYCLFHEELCNGHTFIGGSEWEVEGVSKQKTLS